MKPTDLIINEDGSVYHLSLRPEELPDIVVVAGDPGRIQQISHHFSHVESRKQNREFVSHIGEFNHKRILALSTGIGPDNIDIVMNELDALANIDFKDRSIRSGKRSITIVRLGTSGTFHREFPVGSYAVSSHGLGLDGSLHYYSGLKDVMDPVLTEEFIRQSHWPAHLPKPYVIEGSRSLISRLEKIGNTGITATGPGFYGPQGRELRLGTSFPEMLDAIGSFNYNGLRIVNFEMETSSLFGLGRMLGHEVASLCVVLANRITGEYSKNAEKNMDKLIGFVLEQLTI
jgi:uridine phosphorylase